MLDALEKIFIILGIFVGGMWAYYHFIKGRVYKHRLEQNISGKIIFSDDVEYLVIKISLKNVGLSKIDIQQKGSALRVFACEEEKEVPNTVSVKWQRLRTFPVFKKHKWIESKETVQEERLIVIPKKNYVAYKAQLKLISKKLSWNIFTIIERNISKETSKKVISQINLKERRKAMPNGKDIPIGDGIPEPGYVEDVDENETEMIEKEKLEIEDEEQQEDDAERNEKEQTEKKEP